MLTKVLIATGLMTPITLVLAADALGGPITTADGLNWWETASITTALIATLAGLIWWYRREQRSVIRSRRD